MPDFGQVAYTPNNNLIGGGFDGAFSSPVMAAAAPQSDISDASSGADASAGVPALPPSTPQRKRRGRAPNTPEKISYATDVRKALDFLSNTVHGRHVLDAEEMQHVLDDYYSDIYGVNL